MNAPKKVILDIAPLGDIMMMRAVSVALKGLGWEPTIRVPDFALSLALQMQVPVIGAKEEVEGVTVLKMGDYLNYDTHFESLPMAFRSSRDILRPNGAADPLGHLCQWMGVHAATLLGIEPFAVDPGEVRLALTADSLISGETLLREQVQSNKPTVILSVGAGSQNRILPPGVILEVIELLGNDAQAVLLKPLPNGLPGFDGIDVPYVECKNLALLPAFLFCADAVVSTDSGPFHIAAAAIQGARSEGESFDLEEKSLILAAGSSSPYTLLYKGNQFVQAPASSCPILPCGRHGYGDTIPARMDGHQFFEIKNSLCIYPEYTATGLAPCMKAISAEQIVAKVREAIA